MTNFLSLVGFLLPPIIDLINNKITNKDIRFWMSVVVCAVVGTLVELVTTGGLTIEGASTQIMLTFGMAQLTFNALWKGSSAEKELKKLSE